MASRRGIYKGNLQVIKHFVETGVIRRHCMRQWEPSKITPELSFVDEQMESYRACESRFLNTSQRVLTSVQRLK